MRQERDEPADRKRSQGHAKDAASARKEQAIGEKLTSDPASGSAESETGADLPPARRAAGEKEAGNIEAGEAEQDAGGGEQEPERLGEAAAQRRMALGRRREFESGCQKDAAVGRRKYSGSRRGGCSLRAWPEPGLQAGLRLRGVRHQGGGGRGSAASGWGCRGDPRRSVCSRPRHGRGNPEGRDGADVDAAEAGGGDAGHGHGVFVDQDLAADDIGGAAELRLPEVVGEHHHWTGAGRGIVFGVR